MLRVWLIDSPGSGSPGQSVLAQYAAAIQKGISGDYAAQYNRDCLFQYGDAKDFAAGDQVLDLVATMDQPGALGDHSPDGSGRISPLLDAQDGAALSQTIDHELKEMLEDLLCDVVRVGGDGNLYADESCDAVESDPDYTIDGVTLSNFVWASWYTGSGAKYDQRGTLKAPYTVSPGGYGQRLDPTAGWQQFQSSDLAPRAYRKKSRRLARRMARWLSNCPTSPTVTP